MKEVWAVTSFLAFFSFISKNASKEFYTKSFVTLHWFRLKLCLSKLTERESCQVSVSSFLFFWVKCYDRAGHSATQNETLRLTTFRPVTTCMHVHSSSKDSSLAFVVILKWLQQRWHTVFLFFCFCISIPGKVVPFFLSFLGIDTSVQWSSTRRGKGNDPEVMGAPIDAQGAARNQLHILNNQLPFLDGQSPVTCPKRPLATTKRSRKECHICDNIACQLGKKQLWLWPLKLSRCPLCKAMSTEKNGFNKQSHSTCPFQTHQASIKIHKLPLMRTKTISSPRPIWGLLDYKWNKIAANLRLSCLQIETLFD